MIYPYDFHIHSLYCDGKNTPEETAVYAIEKGLKAIGFSGHSFTSFDRTYAMSESGTKDYISEINRLKIKYGDRINIYCGVEKDYYSLENAGKYDYCIGSVHYVKAGGNYLEVDSSAEQLAENVGKYFSGNYYLFAELYYDNVADIHSIGCDIAGHFDLITKFNENGVMFDESNATYRDAALAACDALLEKDIVFEVNTGAMARGYRTKPYPSEFILRRILEKNGKILLSGDTHEKSRLCYAFDETAGYLKSLGFTHAVYIGGGKFAESKL